MTYTIHKSNVRVIRQSEPDFIITDGYAVHPRASIEISVDCPRNIARSIEQYIMNGWIKTVANVKDNELVWERLTQ